MDQMRPIVEQKDVPLKFLVSFVLLIKIRINQGHTESTSVRPPCRFLFNTGCWLSTSSIKQLTGFDLNTKEYLSIWPSYSLCNQSFRFQNSLWFAFYNLMMCHCTVEVKASKIMDCTGRDSDTLRSSEFTLLQSYLRTKFWPKYLE